MGTPQLAERDTAVYARVPPPCPYFGACGGCNLQDLSYPDQLSLKRDRLQRTLAPLGLPHPPEVAGLDEPWRYRNKAEFTFGRMDGRLVLGYHAAKSYWRVVDLEECLLLPEPVAPLLRDARALAAETGLDAYVAKTRQGFFRHLLVRSAQADGRMLVCLITAPGERGPVEGIARELIRRHPALASVYWGVTSRVSDVAVPETLTLLGGEAHLEDRVGPFRLKLHPRSFLQPSSVQAERLYAVVEEAIRRVTDGVVWDLYCGIGLIGFYLSRHVRKVYGIDVEGDHLALAAENASRNGVRNIEFHAGRVETLLRDRRFWLQEAKPDAVVVDPPRAGLHPTALSSVLAARPPHLIYLSCNAQSLVRDLGALCSSYPRYHVEAMRAFDMFPQTNHLETVAICRRG